MAGMFVGALLEAVVDYGVSRYFIINNPDVKAHEQQEGQHKPAFPC